MVTESNIEQKVVPPDPRVADVLTHNPYPLPNALSELIDNSIDASATIVLVRFLRSEDRVLALQVIDNGEGISPGNFDQAMTFGFRNPHKLKDIGMYGVGLKTASLSQSDELRVMSKIRGGKPEGREWLRKNLDDSLLNSLPAGQVARAFEVVDTSDAAVNLERSGTIIEWGCVHDLERSQGDADRYLKMEMLDVESHLGLVFHRLLEAGKVRIFLDVTQDGVVVDSRSVLPLNPFKYPRSADRNYPKEFIIKIPGSAVSLSAVAHIWPPRTKLREYKIRRVGGRTNTIDSQGLYFYYNDRLVMPGGWGNVRTAEAHFSLARMEINLKPDAMKILVIGYSKDNVRIPSSFVEALRTSKATDGSSFAKWVDRAQEIFRTPAEGAVALPSLPVPQKGLPPAVSRKLKEVNVPSGTRIEIMWRELGPAEVFKVDRQNERLILNRRYKPEIVSGGLDRADGGLFKLLLMLMLREHFGSRAGARLKALESVYQEILKSGLGR